VWDTNHIRSCVTTLQHPILNRRRFVLRRKVCAYENVAISCGLHSFQTLARDRKRQGDGFRAFSGQLQLLQDVAIERQIRHQLLQLAIFLAQPPQLPQFTPTYPGGFAFPCIKCLLAQSPASGRSPQPFLPSACRNACRICSLVGIAPWLSSWVLRQHWREEPVSLN
jgi:hypothetical protein